MDYTKQEEVIVKWLEEADVPPGMIHEFIGYWRQIVVMFRIKFKE